MAKVTTLPVDEPSIDNVIEEIVNRFDREPSHRKELVVKSLTSFANRVFWPEK